MTENPLPKIRSFDGHDWFSTKVYRRNLPHWELEGSTYFITLRVERQLGKPFTNPDLANYLINRLKQEHGCKYLLHAYVIMPDHLHLIIKPISRYTLAQIFHHFKGSTAYEINKILNRSGKFWQKESYDHLIRNEIGLCEKMEYIKENPVQAKLVDCAENYPFSSFYGRLKR